MNLQHIVPQPQYWGKGCWLWLNSLYDYSEIRHRPPSAVPCMNHTGAWSNWNVNGVRAWLLSFGRLETDSGFTRGHQRDNIGETGRSGEGVTFSESGNLTYSHQHSTGDEQ